MKHEQPNNHPGQRLTPTFPLAPIIYIGLFMIGTIAGKVPRANATPLTAAIKPKQQELPPGAWLQKGALHESEREWLKAGDAYKVAFESFSPRSKRGVEGANTSMRSAHAYWRAFSIDLNINHIDSAIEALLQWTELVDPRDKARESIDVIASTLFRLQVIEFGLSSANEHLKSAEYATASERYTSVFDAISDSDQKCDLASQSSEGLATTHCPFSLEGWGVGVRIAVRASDILVADYESRHNEDSAQNADILITALQLLEYWEFRKRPSNASQESSLLQLKITRIKKLLGSEEDSTETDGAQLNHTAPKKKIEMDTLLPPVRPGYLPLFAAVTAGGISWTAWTVHTLEAKRCREAEEHSLFGNVFAQHCANTGTDEVNFDHLQSGMRELVKAMNLSAWILAPLAGQLRGRYDAARHFQGGRRPQRFGAFIGVGLSILAASGALGVGLLTYEKGPYWFANCFLGISVCMSPTTFSALRQASSTGLAIGGGLMQYGLGYRREWRARRILDVRVDLNSLSVVGWF